MKFYQFKNLVSSPSSQNSHFSSIFQDYKLNSRKGNLSRVTGDRRRFERSENPPIQPSLGTPCNDYNHSSPQFSQWFPHLFVSYEDEEYRSPQLDRVRSRIRINFHPRFLPPIPNPTDSRWRGEALYPFIKNHYIFRAPIVFSDSRLVPKNVYSPYGRAADTSKLKRIRIIKKEKRFSRKGRKRGRSGGAITSNTYRFFCCLISLKIFSFFSRFVHFH